MSLEWYTSWENLRLSSEAMNNGRMLPLYRYTLIASRNIGVRGCRNSVWGDYRTVFKKRDHRDLRTYTFNQNTNNL